MNLVPTEKSVTLDCGLLRLVFQHVGDRWEHTIAPGEAPARRFVHSIEGRPDDPWPTSPALQELHVERRGDESMAFLTGMAGGSHWSASIVCRPERHEATFDIACRCKQAPLWLGSGYRVEDDAVAILMAGTAELGGPKFRHRAILQSSGQIGPTPAFAAGPDDPAAYALAERIRGMRQTLFVSPTRLTVGTVRWEYTIRAADP